MPLRKKKLFALPNTWFHLSCFSFFFILTLCVVFCWPLLVLCSFDHCVFVFVCITTSQYPFGIFKLFLYLYIQSHIFSIPLWYLQTFLIHVHTITHDQEYCFISNDFYQNILNINIELFLFCLSIVNTFHTFIQYFTTEVRQKSWNEYLLFATFFKNLTLNLHSYY